jgi:hypothetical protein
MKAVVYTRYGGMPCSGAVRYLGEGHTKGKVVVNAA